MPRHTPSAAFDVILNRHAPLDLQAIADNLVITAGVVEKHIASIFAKLGLAPSDSDNRRVIAAVRYLES